MMNVIFLPCDFVAFSHVCIRQRIKFFFVFHKTLKDVKDTIVKEWDICAIYVYLALGKETRSACSIVSVKL